MEENEGIPGMHPSKIDLVIQAVVIWDRPEHTQNIASFLVIKMSLSS